MTQAEKNRILTRISTAIAGHVATSSLTVRRKMPKSKVVGKIYEVAVLSEVIEHLVTTEGCSISMHGGSKLRLRMAGGPIDTSYTYFSVSKTGGISGELYTDIEFTGLSTTFGKALSPGDLHELDIALVTSGTTGFPRYDQVLIGVECKHTAIEKSIIREMMGFRRQLTFQQNVRKATGFARWPATHTQTDPASVSMIYSNDPTIMNYQHPCEDFGIITKHLRM